MKHFWLTFLVLCGLIQWAWAQSQVVERAAKGQPGKDIQLGVYLNVRPDCTSGPLPTIRLSGRPEHGTVTVKKAKINATNFKQCLALEVPGYVAFYRSQPNFSGVDVLTLEVKFPGGRSETQRITVRGGLSSPGEGA
jgi:hypothetical protein